MVHFTDTERNKFIAVAVDGKVTITVPAITESSLVLNAPKREIDPRLNDTWFFCTSCLKFSLGLTYHNEQASVQTIATIAQQMFSEMRCCKVTLILATRSRQRSWSSLSG